MIASVSKTIEKIYRAWICQQVDFKVLCDLFQSSESNHNHRILPESSESIASNCHRMNASVSMTLESIDRAWICQQFDFKVIATVWLLLSLGHLKNRSRLNLAAIWSIVVPAFTQSGRCREYYNEVVNPAIQLETGHETQEVRNTLNEYRNTINEYRKTSACYTINYSKTNTKGHN